MSRKIMKKCPTASHVIGLKGTILSPKMKNAWVDLLPKLAISEYTDIQKPTYLETLERPSIEDKLTQVMWVDHEPSWMNLLIRYLQEGSLPRD